MRSWLWLAVLSIAVAALGAWVYYKPTPGQSQTHALSSLKPGEVKHLELLRPPAGPQPAAGPIVLEKREGQWRMTAPIAARAESFQVERLLSIIEARSSVRYPAADLARFGLDRPVAVLTLEDQAYTFGAINTTTREQYVMTGNQVYLVPLAYIATLPRNADALLAKRLWAADETPVRFDLPDFTVSLEDGTWAVAPAMPDVGPDERNAWVEGWRQASAISAARRGAGKPDGQIKVQLKDGRTIALGIVQREPDLVLAREDEGVEYRFVAEAAKRMLSPPGALGVKK
jgi:hypothetical protein